MIAIGFVGESMKWGKYEVEKNPLWKSLRSVEAQLEELKNSMSHKGSYLYIYCVNRPGYVGNYLLLYKVIIVFYFYLLESYGVRTAPYTALWCHAQSG